MEYIGVITCYNPLILTIDPNFQRDIQVGVYDIPLFPMSQTHRRLLSPSAGRDLYGQIGSLDAQVDWNMQFLCSVHTIYR